MIAVIAEKPSVAREIAAQLGATDKKDGYLTGNGYCVTWALGHLVGLGMPEDYGIMGFRAASLPILPDPFVLKVRTIKNEKGYSTDTGAMKQLGIISKVLQQCDSIIVATDAGREGELIFRSIYEYLQCLKPFQRLWISSLTEKAIRSGMDNLKPGSDFDGLFRAARARSRADWLVGINASQALGITAGNTNYSLGRVQTPTLAMICSRYLDHTNFIRRDYWQVQLEFSKGFIDFKCISRNRWDDEKPALSALKSIQRSQTATVADIDRNKVTEQPPLLFDLTGLQKEANLRLGLTAEQTLDIAQGLYEKRFITYPRTGSKHIPEDVWAEIPKLVKALEDRPPCKEPLAKLKWGRLNKRIVNDLKVTDHHGLLVTERIPSALAPRENAVYEMIALRLLEAVSQACVKEVTTVVLEALHYSFELKGVVVQDPGWRSIKGNFSCDNEPPVLELPDMEIGDALQIKNSQLLQKCTNPPVLYTEAGLLSAMETAGREVEDIDARKAIQNLGIGTPATRAAIIETLFSRAYISREKKSLIPTEKGLQVYHLIKDKKIANVAMTAAWEAELLKIENGELEENSFQSKIEHYCSVIIGEILDSVVAMDEIPKLECPKCKQHQLLIRDRLVKCPDTTCGWVQFRNVCGVTLSIADIEALVKKGRTPFLKGLSSRSGKRFDAHIALQDNGQTYFEFEKVTAP